MLPQKGFSKNTDLFSKTEPDKTSVKRSAYTYSNQLIMISNFVCVTKMAVVYHTASSTQGFSSLISHDLHVLHPQSAHLKMFFSIT